MWYDTVGVSCFKEKNDLAAVFEKANVLSKNHKDYFIKGELVSERMLKGSLSLLSTWEEKDTKFNPKKQWQNSFKLFKFLPSCLLMLLTL